MRNEDLSNTGSDGLNQSASLSAHDDYDVIPAGAHGPASGNTLTGNGTVSGQAGADVLGAGHALLVSISGAGGTDADASGGQFQVEGRYGTIKIDSHGNYTYARNAGTPDGVTDTFTYAIADKSGHQDTARLAIRIEGEKQNLADAQRVTVGPDGIVTLPAGVSLSDVRVVGRDLVIDMPDGTQMIIVDGAVFVPQLVFGGVEVPATNLAALLIDSEPQPAAGAPQSSGGNFEVPVGPLDPGVPLGDLIPPTELTYIPPDYEEVGEFIRDRAPDILIQTPDQPAGAVNATATVDEGALPARGIEPEGSHSASTAEGTSGTIVYNSPDGPNVVTLNGVAITAVGQVFHGAYGDLTITSIANGTIGYNYLLLDNTSGDTTHDNFAVVVTDNDGDTAAATLTVNIIDDVPTARNDTDSLSEDATSTDGNVMTGTGTTSGAPGADTVGADNAHVENAGTYQLTYGSLVIHADGSYVYTLYTAESNPTAYAAVQALNTGQTLTDSFLYTLVDGDTDHSSATLTITIVGATDNRPPSIGSASVAVSEEGTAGGIADGNGIPTAAADTTNSATASGDLTVSDPNGNALTLTLGVPLGSFTSHGVPVTWALSPDGHTLTGSAGETTVITVTLTNAGHYVVTLGDQFDHPNTTGEDAFNIVVPVTASDGLLSTPATITIQVEDDMPILSDGVRAGASVTVDETDASEGPVWAGPISATSSGAVISAPVNYGADGSGTAPVYALSLNAAASALQTAVGDHAITLSILGNTITGTYNDGADHVAFTVAIDTATGQVTLTQFVPLEHLVDGTDAAAFNDSLDLGDLVSASVTYHDYDGDSVTATTPIGDNLVFLDDGPAVDVVVSPPQGEGEVSFFPVLQTGDDGTEGLGFTTDSSSANFSGSFSLLVDGGADGAAGTPAIDYSFNLVSSVSGLTSHGAAINLYIVDGQVVGSTLGGAPVSATDASVIFSIAVDASGNVTLTQFQQIDHSIADDPTASDSPFVDQVSSFGSGLVELVGSATVTDNDGDSDSDSASLDLGGLIRFADDGPTIVKGPVVDSSVTLDETDGSNPVSSGAPIIVTSAGPIIEADIDYGADGPGAATAYGISLNGGASSLDSGLQTARGDHEITLTQTDATTITGTYNDGSEHTAFIVHINTNGTLTVTQYAALEHLVDGSTPADFDDALDLSGGELGSLINATATYSDFDGDTVTATIGIGDAITFLDDGPAVNPRSSSLVEVDEDELPLGITDGDLVTTIDGGSLGALVDFGGDGAGSFKFDLAGSSLPATLTSNSAPIVYAVSADGLTLTAYTGANPAVNQIFTVAITDAATGAYTVTLLGQIDHLPNSPADDDNQVLDINLSTAIVATDADGDFVRLTEGVTLRIEDDIPVQLQGNANGAVGEDLLLGGNPDASDAKTTVATGSLAGLVSFGADQPGSFKFDGGALASLTAQALASGGVALSYNVSADGLTLTAYTGASVGTGNVFTVALTAGGAYTFTLLDQLDHLPNVPANDDNQNLSINLAGVVVATDADGDKLPLSGGFTISVEDDIPAGKVGNGGTTVDEDELPGGITDGDGVTTSATGLLSNIASFGADQPGSFKFDLTGATLPSITAGGLPVNYAVTNGGLTLVAYTGANPALGQVFTVTITNAATGAYTFTLLHAIDHIGPLASGSGDAQILSLDLSTAVLATDADNDSIHLSSGFVVTVEDDIPVTFVPDAATLVNNASGLFNGFLDIDDSIANNVGADGGKAVFVAAGLPTTLKSGGVALVYTISADGHTLTANAGISGPLVFTATISGSAYQIDMNGTIDSLSTVDFASAGYTFVGGNNAWAGFVKAGDNNSSDLLITPGDDPTSINTSGILGGVGTGQSLGSGESFWLDYVTDLVNTPSSSGNYADPGKANHAFDGHYTTNGGSVLFVQSTGTTLKISAYDDLDGNNLVHDGSIDAITKITISYAGVAYTNGADPFIIPTTTTTAYTVNGKTFNVTLNADGSVNVAGVTGTSGAGAVGTQIAIFTANGYNSAEYQFVSGDTVKFGGFGAQIQSTSPVVFDIPVAIVDGDGDTVAGTPIAVTLNAAPPVVLDTNHDGQINYLSTDNGVLYDMNHDGALDQTAWVAAGDSILFRDADGNGTVTDSSEFVFGGNGVTDMEALHAQYGAQLDASDADFTQFGVWNDANSNGLVDAGEVQSLIDAGITSIGLISDGVNAILAGGDVTVAGSSSYTYVNDNGDAAEGQVDDAAFAYRDGAGDLDQRLAATSSNVGVVAAAVAAMGLAQASAEGGRQADDDPANAGKANPGHSSNPSAPVLDEAGTNHSLINSETRVAVIDDDQAQTSATFATSSESRGLGEVSLQVAQPLAADEFDEGGSATDNALSMIDVAPAFVMAEAVAQPAAHNDRGNADQVHKVVAEAIDHGGDIDQLLANLPTPQTANAALASQGGDGVPAWDSGHFGGFTPQVASTIAIEAMMLHHDAAPAA